MAGEMAMHPTQQHILRRVSARMPWLLVTLGGTYLAAMLIEFYEGYFDAGNEPSNKLWTLLLLFIPMIGGMAGNVGIQSSTVMVRGLATGEVYPSIFLKVLLKEVLIAAVIGMISGIVIGVLLVVFRGDIGFVVALALFAAIVMASFIGTMMPFVCLVIKVDPAYASGPVLTTLNDLVGYAIYFSIALPFLA
jgi:magnesium transporter